MLKIAVLILLALGLMIHLAVGNSYEVILEDAVKTIPLLVGGIATIILVKLSWKIFTADTNLYKRNQRAAVLCKKVRHQKTLTDSEHAEYEKFCHAGVIININFAVNTETNTWVFQPKVSDYAIDEVFN